MFGLLVRRRHDFHLVAALQHLAERHDLAVDACARAGIANLRMDVVGEVKDGSTLRELIEVALRREHKYLVFVEVHLELVHRLHTVASLQHRTDIGEPFVQSGLALDALVTPVGSDAAFGYFIHALGTDLNLHPFLLRT